MLEEEITVLPETIALSESKALQIIMEGRCQIAAVAAIRGAKGKSVP